MNVLSLKIIMGLVQLKLIEILRVCYTQVIRAKETLCKEYVVSAAKFVKMMDFVLETLFMASVKDQEIVSMGHTAHMRTCV